MRECQRFGYADSRVLHRQRRVRAGNGREKPLRIHSGLSGPGLALVRAGLRAELTEQGPVAEPQRRMREARGKKKITLFVWESEADVSVCLRVSVRISQWASRWFQLPAC